MADIEVMEAGAELREGYDAPACAVEGPARSVRFQPDGFSLWEVEAELGAGAELQWAPAHGDEVVYVLDGELELDGSQCGPATAVIVEAGVVAAARATRDVRIESPDGDHGSVHYADSTCDTCRVTFFENYVRSAHVVSSHTHTQDEIIRMTSGELQVGRVTLRAGMSIAIPADRRYGFRTPGPFSFLNYRRDLSMYVGAPGSDPLPETVDTARSVRSVELTG
jgi:quercetin dioxygenase-like cupin family protein